jgi:RNA polymerase sigma-70 factor (ECF subfamily)
MQSDDAHLVERVLAGEKECFRTLVARHTTMVRAVIYSMIGGRSSVDDLAQEAFLRSFKYLGSLADHSKYGGWLCGITRRVCLDFLRSHRKPMLSLDEISEAGADLPRAEDASVELKNQVHEAVMNLPEHLRQVTLMRYVDRYSYERMAEILGVSRATVSARLIQARKLLREKLGSRPGSG